MNEKKIIISGFICIGITILAVLFYGYWTEWRFEQVRIGGSMKYGEEYADYYYKTKTKWIRPWLSRTNTDVTIIYFLPSQKEKMLEKIKEDVINELEKRVEEYGSIYYRYEISDDFKKIRIYDNRSDEDRRSVTPSTRLSSIIGLYHQIKEGRIVSIPTDYTFETIKSDG